MFSATLSVSLSLSLFAPLIHSSRFLFLCLAYYRSLSAWKCLPDSGNKRGTHSVFTTFRDYQIMFHVSTMLACPPGDTEKLCRSRMIGNDIVNVIFMEGTTPYNPTTLLGAVTRTCPLRSTVTAGKRKVFFNHGQMCGLLCSRCETRKTS